MASRGVDRGTAELNALQKLPSPTQDEAEVSSEDERMSDSEPEKDATEEELEKLVFGDNAGFREEIQTFGHRNYSGHKESSEEPGHKHINALTTINDEDLFFLDSQPGQINEGTLAAPYGGEDEYVASRGRGPPVWEDSDDEKMSISLMAVPRLRKLRHFEGEDVITGRDYVRRLRRQYVCYLFVAILRIANGLGLRSSTLLQNGQSGLRKARNRRNVVEILTQPTRPPMSS